MPLLDGTGQPAPQSAGLPAQPPRAVMLKLHDSSDIAYQDDVESEIEARGLLPWASLKTQFPGIRLRRMFTSVTTDELKALVIRAVATDPSYDPPNFRTYFVIDSPMVDPLDVAASLRQLPGVHYAYAAPASTLPATVTADSRTQGFQGPAPDGIDAFHAWGLPGSDGAGQAYVDLEAGWTLDHEDLGLDGKVAIINGGPSVPNYASHGTRVLGIISALDNGSNCVGLAPQARVGLVSNGNPTTMLLDTTLIPDAIVASLTQLEFGNVLLLEVQVAGKVNGVPKYLPCESNVDCFATIRLASALGVVVVEPAATDDVDLDAFVNDFGQHSLDPNVPGEFWDSGAIMVGAATSSAPHTHLDSRSGRGARLDAYGWGENVTTCDSDQFGDTGAYTNDFSGTSAAAAIVAGGVLCMQGMVEHAHKRRLSPWEIRAIFRDPLNVTLVTGRVANRGIPNLGVITTLLDVAPDVYIRDYVGDSGAPDGGTQATSPDIIVRAAAESDPTAAFGSGSGTEDNAWLSDPVQTGQDNYVYVRVRNRGGADAANVAATVYWSEPATLITPDVWNVIGSATMPAVPADDQLVVSPVITWIKDKVPAPGHYCLVAIVGNAQDPSPLAADFATWPGEAWNYFVRFITANNNVAWRNVDVVSPATFKSGAIELDFLMRGAFDRARPMKLEIVTRLPADAQVALAVPDQLAELWRAHWPSVKRRKHHTFIPLPRRGRLALPAIDLPARRAVPLKIFAHLPKGACNDGQRFTVYARQVWQGIELGRVTWRVQRDRERAGHKPRPGQTHAERPDSQPTPRTAAMTAAPQSDRLPV